MRFTPDSVMVALEQAAARRTRYGCVIRMRAVPLAGPALQMYFWNAIIQPLASTPQVETR
jgi:hypothetical protein